MSARSIQRPRRDIYRPASLDTREKLAGSCSQQNLNYHGGPLVTGSVTLYNIYVGLSPGDYSGSTTPSIIENFSSSFSKSSYWSILEDYYSNLRDVPTFVFGGNAFVGHNSMTLTDSDVVNIIKYSIRNNPWSENNAIYAIIFRGDFSYCTSSKSSNSCWNTDWCGFHSIFKSAYIGMVMGDTAFSSDKAGCSTLFNGDVYTQGIQWSGASPSGGGVFVSPNGNDAADSLVSVYAHELFEAVTDSNGGWYRDCDGYEMGDMCESTYGYIMTSEGRNFNVEMGGHQFLVQSEWLVSAAPPGCGMSSSSIISPPQGSGYSSLSLSNPSTSWIIYTIIGVAVAGAVLLLLVGSKYCSRSQESGLQPTSAPAFVPLPPPPYVEAVSETLVARPLSDLEARNFLIGQVGFDPADVEQMQPADMRSLALSLMNEDIVAGAV